MRSPPCTGTRTAGMTGSALPLAPRLPPCRCEIDPGDHTSEQKVSLTTSCWSIAAHKHTAHARHESLPREALGTTPQRACEAPSSSSACTTEG
eukprot:542929-Rhodomonas_salina.1